MDKVSEIKNRLSIVDVVSDFVKLSPAGRNFKGLCPFHNDSRPSLIVSPDREICWCFACNSGGDIFSFIQKIENVSFAEALSILAEKAGVKLENFSPEKKEKNDRILEILEIATQKFEQNFWSNSIAQKFVAERKISDQTFKKFRVGFAENDFHKIEKFLLEKGFSHREIAEAGLIVPTKNDQFCDKFRNRICFPFFSKSNSVVGFAARSVGIDEKPKFLNSPETAVFKKSDILFGFNFAKNFIRESGFCLVVEGQFDALACFDKNFKNVVATSGTAFSARHATQIARVTNEIVFALDGDAAGIAATRRAAGISAAANLEIFVAVLPENKDPDDILREKNGAEKFQKILQNRCNAIEFFIEKNFQTAQNLTEKKAAIFDVFEIIAQFPQKISHDHFLKILAEKTKIDLNFLIKDFEQFLKKNKNFVQKKTENNNQKFSGKNISNLEILLGSVFSFSDFIKLFAQNLILEIFPDGKIKKVLNKIFEQKISPNLENFDDEEKFEFQKFALFAEEKFGAISDKLKPMQFEKFIQKINRENCDLLMRKMRENPDEYDILELQKIILLRQKIDKNL